MDPREIRRLLETLQTGGVSVDDALERLRHLPFEDVGVATIDHHRALRQGAPEVILGQGKSVEQLLTIIGRMLEHGSNVLVTRLDAVKAAPLLERFPRARYHADARLLTIELSPPQARGAGPVAVICAGTSDLPVAKEAAITLRMLGHEVEEVIDVGVAGLHRLLARSDVLHRAAVLIVVAGMEGALPSVIGGMVAAPVIAVPTSVGYGTAFGGVAALLGMLNSCASGVTVVNIDNGFGAAFAAHRINRTEDS